MEKFSSKDIHSALKKRATELNIETPRKGRMLIVLQACWGPINQAVKIETTQDLENIFRLSKDSNTSKYIDEMSIKNPMCETFVVRVCSSASMGIYDRADILATNARTIIKPILKVDTSHVLAVARYKGSYGNSFLLHVTGHQVKILYQGDVVDVVKDIREECLKPNAKRDILFLEINKSGADHRVMGQKSEIGSTRACYNMEGGQDGIEGISVLDYVGTSMQGTGVMCMAPAHFDCAVFVIPSHHKDLYNNMQHMMDNNTLATIFARQKINCAGAFILSLEDYSAPVAPQNNFKRLEKE